MLRTVDGLIRRDIKPTIEGLALFWLENHVPSAFNKRNPKTLAKGEPLRDSYT